MKRRYWLLSIAAVVAVVGFIFFNSVLSDAQSDKISSFVGQFLRPVLNPLQVIPTGTYRKLIRKLGHFIEFAVLGGFLAFGAQKLDFKGKWIVAAALAVLIACFDETIQRFSADRTNSIFDICIDLAGSACGMITVNMIKKQKKRGMHHG